MLRALRSLVRDRGPVGSLRRSRQQRCRQREESFAAGETCSEPLLPSHGAPPGRRTRICSLTGELEAQLQRLNFSEEDSERGAGGEGLERDFSVQSMTSMINEDCFYESLLMKVRGQPAAADPTSGGLCCRRHTESSITSLPPGNNQQSEHLRLGRGPVSGWRRTDAF